VRGSWQVGLDAMQTPVGIAAVCGLGLLVLIWAWAWWHDAPVADEIDEIRPRGKPAAASRACWVFAGALLFLGAFIPIAMIARQNVEPRTLYFPLVGMVIVLAQALDAALAAVPSAGSFAKVARSLRATVAVVVGMAAIAACICCVGIQQWYSLRAHRDEQISRRLAELVPDPPANAVYIPFALDAGPTSTSLVLFDRLRPGAFNTTWSATALMQESTRRRDILAAAINPWAKFPLDRFSAEGFWTSMQLDGRASDSGQKGEFVSWDRVIPFAVDDSGRVRLVRQIDITRPDERVDTFHPPLVRAAIRAGTARGHATALTLTDSADLPPKPLAGWRLLKAAEADEPLAFPLRTSRGTQRPATWLHPTFDSGTRAAMLVPVDAAGGPRTIRFHVTTPPEEYARFPKGEPVTLHIELMPEGDATSPLVAQSVELTRERADAEPRWIAIDFQVPALAEAAAIRVRATSKRGAESAPVWVTAGMWLNARLPGT
jgi:hypothetical protein